MKFFKKVLVLILIIGIAVGGIWVIRKIGETRLRPSESEGFGEAKEKPIKFAVMSDIHSDWGNFKKALANVEGFVIITGDLTTLGLKSELIEAKKILDDSGLKYYVIPGNHDIWWGRKYKKDVWQEVFGNSFQSFKAPYQTVQGKDSRIKFILINNGDGIGGIEGLEGTEGQEGWLKKETEECLKVYCLVFMHMPLNHPTSLHVMGEDNPKVASEAGKIKELLVKDGVKEIFAGHLHFSSSYELGGLKTNIVGAVALERNFQSPKFMEVIFKDGEIDKLDSFVPN